MLMSICAVIPAHFLHGKIFLIRWKFPFSSVSCGRPLPASNCFFFFFFADVGVNITSGANSLLRWEMVKVARPRRGGGGYPG